MLFKDEAAALACRWRALREEDEIEDLAAQTAVALAREPEIPDDVIESLDALMTWDEDERARAVIRVVRYVDSLAVDRDPARA